MWKLRRPLPDLALATSVVDRADHVRDDPRAIDELWDSPTSKLLVLYRGNVQVDPSDRTRVSFTSPRDVASAMPPHAALLGIHEQTAYFALFSPDDAPAPTESASLREVGPALSPVAAELVCTALGLSNWHRTHQFCAQCGQPTRVAKAGWTRRCPKDDSEHFPRTDPAVIMLVTNEHDEALLGHRGAWPESWFSTLAGFVEPGESAESAVAREVAEEVAVLLDPTSIVCLGSQPWPFPSSLMIGYQAVAMPGQQPQPDGTEIAAARWFSRDELRQACQAGSVALPARFSISRHLIEHWFGRELPGSWGR